MVTKTIAAPRKVAISTGVQTPPELLPTATIKEGVPVFKEEDIAIQLDSVIGTEIDKTVHKLQDFVTINKVNRLLDSRATLIKNLGPFEKGFKINLSNSDDKFTKEERTAQKKHRKELV